MQAGGVLNWAGGAGGVLLVLVVLVVLVLAPWYLCWCEEVPPAPGRTWNTGRPPFEWRSVGERTVTVAL